MPTRPLISIILPTYNREGYLREAVASVLAQTYDPWELLVVDDGSTDGTRAYLDTLVDPRVRCVLHDHCGNAALLRNVAARVVRGSYIAFLDSDDVWLPEKLAVQWEDLRAHPQCRWSYMGRVYIDEKGREPQWPGLRRWEPYAGWIVEQVIDTRALVAMSSVMVERGLFETMGGFDESVGRCEDYDLWIKFAEASPVTVVPTFPVQKRLHPEERSSPPLDVLSHMNRIYEGLLTRTTSPRVRRLCRRQRARVSTGIVAWCRALGSHADAWRALRVSLPHAWWYPGWWAAVLKTVLRPAIPGSLLSLYHGVRTRGAV